MESSDETELVALHEEPEPAGFDVVLRGYDRRQVDDYLDRVEVALAEADGRHFEDGERLAQLGRQLEELSERLREAEDRAAGRPERASLIGARLLQMLTLAEEQAGLIVAEARAEGEGLVLAARDLLARETSAQRAELDEREQDAASASEDAARLRLEAQRDAEVLRANARQEADHLLQDARTEAERLRTEAIRGVETERARAQEEADYLRTQGQEEAAAMTHEARRQLADLSAQRDGIAAQLQRLRETVAAAVQPLAAAGEEPPPVSL